MVMHPVSSSDIASIGYENGNLYIRFLNGSTYEYFDVPQSVYAGLMSAGSHGKYFHAFIKGKYGYSKL